MTQTSLNPVRFAHRLAVAAGVLSAAAIAAAQTAPPVFREGVALVTVSFTVTDRDGRFVTGLTRDDFVVVDEGRRQPIVGFANEYVPVSLGVLLDASGSMTPSRMNLAHQALTHLIERLRPDDEVFFAEFADEYREVVPWTTSRTALVRGMRDVRGGTYTALFDAVHQAVVVAATGRHPRKALLVISDGEDTTSKVARRRVRERIRAGDVMVYAFGVEATDSPTKLDRGALRNLTDDSGGRTEIVRGFEALDETVARFVHEIGNQYVLAYEPPKARPGEWREIEIETPKLRDVSIRARRGYVAQ